MITWSVCFLSRSLSCAHGEPAPDGSALRTQPPFGFCLSGCFSPERGKDISHVCWPWSTSNAALQSQPYCSLWVLTKKSFLWPLSSLCAEIKITFSSHQIKLISTLLMLCTSDIYTLINYVGFINYLFYGVTVAGQIVLRIKEPDMYRPIKVKTQKEQYFVCNQNDKKAAAQNSKPFEIRTKDLFFFFRFCSENLFIYLWILHEHCTIVCNGSILTTEEVVLLIFAASGLGSRVAAFCCWNMQNNVQHVSIFLLMIIWPHVTAFCFNSKEHFKPVCRGVVWTFWGVTRLTSHPTGKPGVACDLPAVLGLPSGIFPLLWASGVRYWAGHHDDRCPCVFPGSLLGKQATVLWYSYG